MNNNEKLQKYSHFTSYAMYRNLIFYYICQAAISIKINNLFICFVALICFALYLKKIILSNLYIVLS